MFFKYLKTFLTHILVILGIYIVPNTILPLVAIITALFYFYNKRKKVEVLMVGVYSISCKSEAVFYSFIMAFFILTLMDKRKIRYNKDSVLVRKCVNFMIFYSLGLYFVNLVSTGNYFSWPFYLITFMSPFLIYYYVLKENFSEYEIRKFTLQLLIFAIAQTFVAFIFQAVPLGVKNILDTPTMGDAVKGTFTSTDNMAAVIFIAIIPFVVKLVQTNKYIKNYLIILVFLWFFFMSILSDAKTQYFSFIIGGGVFFIFKLLMGKIKINKKILIANFAILIVVLSWSQIEKQTNSILNSQFEYIYGSFNNKVLNYQNTLSTNTRPLINYFIGTGAGTNGSRSANALAYDQLYKKENTSFKLPGFIPAESNEFTRNFLKPLYTEDFVETASYRSALLSSPFNSICALFVEFGVIGFFIYFFFNFKIALALIKNNDYVSITAFVLLVSNIVFSFFEPSFEYNLRYLIFIYLALALRTKREDIYYPNFKIGRIHN